VVVLSGNDGEALTPGRLRSPGADNSRHDLPGMGGVYVGRSDSRAPGRGEALRQQPALKRRHVTPAFRLPVRGEPRP